MKRVTVLFTSPAGATTATDAFMYDHKTILRLEGNEWLWMYFPLPVQLTPADELALDDDSEYQVLEMPSVQIEPAEVERLTALEYVSLIAKTIAEK